MEKQKYTFDRENHWQKYWDINEVNKFNEKSNKKIYSIDTPPPTVSWKIHIGHIFSYTQAEVVARFQKMNWYSIYYPFGFDDNWLPTERLVEKEIWKKWVDMPREDFNKECLNITKEYWNKFKELWQSMWFWVDWSLMYSTISPEVQKISQTSFLKLINDGVIYRKNSPALWCHECQTTIAQAEVERKEMPSIFFDIEFNLISWEKLIISTTRPELLPACVAVFVNPEDVKYKNFVWKEVITPLWDTVKIMTDDKVDMDKWTWAVMCCTYWDETDMYWLKRYKLPEKIILDNYGKLCNTAFDELNWIFYKKARKIIIEIIEKKWKLVSKKDISHDVWTHERCWTPIEILPLKQYFIKIIDIKDKLIEMWDKINWYPSHMKKRYLEWVESLKWDWCISRQRYFWIPVPVWYSKKTWEIILPDISQLPINPLVDIPLNLPDWHTKDDIVPESDVLDTWATSSLTPLINSNFFSENNLNDKLLPMSLRPQAHDIIRTWALYTIVMSYYHTWSIPFSDIMVSWHVLAWKWEKISKSKNNAWSSPEELISKYWADPVRYWACWWWLWKDIIFDEKEIDKWRKLVTKLFNATRYALLNLWDFDPLLPVSDNELEYIDKWAILKTHEISQKMKKSFNSYNVWLAVIEFEKFFWKDFCDNYLEVVKDKIANPEKYSDWERIKKSAQYWLYNSLLNLLKLIAPVLPHISEELYQAYFKTFENEISIHNLVYPTSLTDNDWDFSDINSLVNLLWDVVELIRKHKTDCWIKYGQESKELIVNVEEEFFDKISIIWNDLLSIARSSNLVVKKSKERNVSINL